MKKLIFIFLLLIPFVLTGCGRREPNKTGEDVTLTIWEDPKNIEMITEIAEEFARYYAISFPNAPRLKFNIIPQSEKSAVENLILYGPAGQGPDILAFVHDTLGTAVNGNHLSVNQYVHKIEATHSDAAAQAASLNGIMYGFPITSESQILIYKTNKINIEQARNLETIIGTSGANAKLVWDVFEGYYSFGLLNDAILYGEDGETTSGVKSSYLNFATPQAKANVMFLRENFKGNTNLMIPGSTSGTTDIEGLNYFLSNQADAIIVAPYFWAEAKKQFGDQVAMAQLPMINGEQMRPFSGYKLYGVSRYSKHPALAQALADFMVGEWAQAIRFRDKSLLPTVTSLTSQLDKNTIMVDSWRGLETTRVTISKNSIVEGRIFLESLEQSITMPKITRFSAFWIAYANNMKALWEQQTLNDSQLTTYLNNITENM